MHVIVDARCCALKLRFEALPGFLSYGEVGAEEGWVTEYERKEPEVSAQDESFAGTVHPRLGTVELARSGHRGEVVIAIKVVVDAFNPRLIGNGVRVEAGEYLASCFIESASRGRGDAANGFLDDTRSKGFGDVRGVVGAAIVDDDDFVRQSSLRT